jgi:Na+-translocating ferredoxin:NAD+ oxidoreductase subunit E
MEGNEVSSVKKKSGFLRRMGIIVHGMIKENPTFVLVLGMCPTLGTTTSAINGLGMGLATTFVLILSNIAISALAGLIPNKVRIPSYIVVIAAFVTVLQLLMQAYVPSLYDTLGLFIPLIVVNCIVLGRAEAYANKNTVLDSACDGIGIGLGFTFALTILGLVREILGSGSAFGWKFMEGDGILVFVLAPGAFIALGYLMVLFRKFTSKIR